MIIMIDVEQWARERREDMQQKIDGMYNPMSDYVKVYYAAVELLTELLDIIEKNKAEAEKMEEANSYAWEHATVMTRAEFPGSKMKLKRCDDE